MLPVIERLRGLDRTEQLECLRGIIHNHDFHDDNDINCVDYFNFNHKHNIHNHDFHDDNDINDINDILNYDIDRGPLATIRSKL